MDFHLYYFSTKDHAHGQCVKTPDGMVAVTMGKRGFEICPFQPVAPICVKDARMNIWIRDTAWV